MRFIGFCIALLCAFSVEARELSDLRAFGESAPSTIYLFSSPNCPHCREFHKTIFPELMKRYVKTKRAQILIVDMVYDHPSLHAAMLMRCLPDAKSQKMMGWLYENQAKWVELKDSKNFFLNYVLPLGMTLNEFNKCLDDTTLANTIVEQRNTLSQLYGVTGWPTMILRQGNDIRRYVGSDRRAILYGLDKDITKFETVLKTQKKAK